MVAIPPLTWCVVIVVTSLKIMVSNEQPPSLASTHAPPPPLVQLGVDVSCSDTGCPPVVIKAAGLQGGTTRVSGKISSQYLSALLMAAPLSSGEVVIEITDELVSAPYVHMTIKLMEKFG